MPSSLRSQASVSTAPQAGARNLLVNCAEVRTGDRLLIAYEPESFGYFDPDIREDIANSAREMGLHVTLVDVGYEPTRTDLPDSVASQLAEVDVILFLSRLGDQLRFSDLPSGPRFVVCFALNSHLLNSPFGTADYRAFVRAKTAVDQRVLAAREIVLTCPAGTLVTGQVPQGVTEAQDTSSLRFPMSVFSPVAADAFSGRVSLGGFLTGTGSQYYDDYTIEFDGPVFAMLEAGRLTGFDGSSADVGKANAHYDRVAAQFGLDRNFVHSWHAGIHPGCGFPWDMRQSYERWGGAAFGNPRVMHFHTCGAYAPGEISWNVFDPTIEVDGLKLWETGQFHLERLPEGQEILETYPCAADVFSNPDRNVGLNETN